MEPVSTALAGIALVKASVNFIKDNINTAKDIGDIASLNELENLVGTMKSSFSVDNMCIGTNISGDKTFILNGWSAAIISEKNTINRTQRLAVQRFDPISLSILPSDVKSLAMLFDSCPREHGTVDCELLSHKPGPAQLLTKRWMT